VFYTDRKVSGATKRVTLVVSKDNKPTGNVRKPPTKLVELGAESFVEMCAAHPEEVKKYVEPIFRDMGIGGVFFVELSDARHAFAADMPADEKVAAKFQAILPKLDDDSPEVRAAAEAELKAMGDTALAPARAIDLAKQPVQTQITLKTLLAAAGGGLEDPRLGQADFLLLCLAVDDAKITALAKARLEKLQGKAVAVDVTAPLDERKKVVEKMLYDGWAAAGKAAAK
jgi:hypothetical protein